MTQFLPPNLLALFAARDPIPFKPPVKILSWEKDRSKTPYTGIANFMIGFEDPKDTPPATRGETRDEKKQRRIKEKTEKRAAEIEEEMKLWDPHNDPNATGDAFKTLFVGRINYDTSENKLRREFEKYGKIKQVKMIKNASNGKPRGYAFIEFEKERDMHSAYKSADGLKIDGRRVMVDVERGRTVQGWKPRRLGGGLGKTRMATEELEQERERERERRRAGSRDRGGRGSRSRERVRSRDRGDSRRTDDRKRDRDRGERRDRDRDRRDRSKDRSDRKRDDRSRKDRDRGDRDKDREKDRRSRRDEEGRDHKKSSRRDRSRDRERRRDRDGKDRDRDRDRGKSDRSKKEVVKIEKEPSNGSAHSNGESKPLVKDEVMKPAYPEAGEPANIPMEH